MQHQARERTGASEAPRTLNAQLAVLQNVLNAALEAIPSANSQVLSVSLWPARGVCVCSSAGARSAPRFTCLQAAQSSQNDPVVVKLRDVLLNLLDYCCSSQSLGG